MNADQWSMSPVDGHSCPDNANHRPAIFGAITAERLRQDAKWGRATNRSLPLVVWMTVLMEEVGEVAECILKHSDPSIELVQVAAVAVAILEALPTSPWGVRDADTG